MPDTITRNWCRRGWPGSRGRQIKLHFIPAYCPHTQPDPERLWGLMHWAYHLTTSATAPSRDFSITMLNFTLRDDVPRNWRIYCDEVTDNFRVIGQKIPDYRCGKGGVYCSGAGSRPVRFSPGGARMMPPVRQGLILLWRRRIRSAPAITRGAGSDRGGRAEVACGSGRQRGHRWRRQWRERMPLVVRNRGAGHDGEDSVERWPQAKLGHPLRQLRTRTGNVGRHHGVRARVAAAAGDVPV